MVVAERESDIWFSRFVGKAFEALTHVPARPESVQRRVPRVPLGELYELSIVGHHLDP